MAKDILSGGVGQKLLQEIIGADNAARLAIGWLLIPGNEEIILLLGNLDSIVVPFNAFESEEIKTAFSDFEILDHGQTLRGGSKQFAIDWAIDNFKN